MITKTNRQFSIIDKPSQTTKQLRSVGFSVSYNRCFNFEKLSRNSDKAKVIEHLVKTGQIKKDSESTKSFEFDTYSHNWLLNKKMEVEGKRNNYAKTIAESYHNSIRPLFTSQRASVMVQTGGFNPNLLNNVDYNAYSKSYGFAAHWKDAAVVIRAHDFDIYTSRATKVGTFPIPPLKVIDRINIDACVNGDLYAIEVHAGVFIRYSQKAEKTGIAVKLPKPGSPSLTYFEHGKNMKEIKAEYRNKIEVAEKKRLEGEERKRNLEIQKRINRAKMLFIRFVSNIRVTYSDARSVGYCKAGIQGFCEKYGLQFSETGSVLFGEIKKKNECSTLVNMIAERYAKEIVLK